jgi:hypothetical protein
MGYTVDMQNKCHVSKGNGQESFREKCVHNIQAGKGTADLYRPWLCEYIHAELRVQLCKKASKRTSYRHE